VKVTLQDAPQVARLIWLTRWAACGAVAAVAVVLVCAQVKVTSGIACHGLIVTVALADEPVRWSRLTAIGLN